MTNYRICTHTHRVHWIVQLSQVPASQSARLDSVRIWSFFFLKISEINILCKYYNCFVRQLSGRQVINRQLSGTYHGICGAFISRPQSSGSHEAVIGQSLGSHWAVNWQSSGSPQAVVSQSLSSRQAVVRQSLGSHQAVIRQSSGSHQVVVQPSSSSFRQSTKNQVSAEICCCCRNLKREEAAWPLLFLELQQKQISADIW